MTFKKLLAVIVSVAVLLACCAVGFSASANQAEFAANTESAKIILNGKVFTANVGDKFTYTLSFYAKEKLEDVQIYFEYDNSIIDAVPYSDSADDCFDIKYAPNLLWPVTNINLDGKIKHNATSADGFDFSQEKVLFTCNFEVLSAGTTSIDYKIEEMTILGGNNSYFTCGQPIVTEGIRFSEDIAVVEEPTASATEATENTEATEATVATDTSEATNPTGSTTEGVEITTGVIDPTEPAETLPGTVSTDDEVTEPSEPTEETTPTETTTPTGSAFDETTDGETTAPTETTTEVTEPVVEGLIGDATLDGKVNIKDVTLIQKYVANILDFDEVQLYLSDTNKDTKVNIKDATAIQKFIAGLIEEF